MPQTLNYRRRARMPGNFPSRRHQALLLPLLSLFSLSHSLSLTAPLFSLYSLCTARPGARPRRAASKRRAGPAKPRLACSLPRRPAQPAFNRAARPAVSDVRDPESVPRAKKPMSNRHTRRPSLMVFDCVRLFLLSPLRARNGNSIDGP